MPFVEDTPSRFTPDEPGETPKPSVNESPMLPPLVSGRLGIHGPRQPRKEDPGSVLRAINEVPYEAGGTVTDIAKRLGTGPEIAAGAGTATNVGLEAIPMLFGGEALKAGVPLKDLGQWFMEKALGATMKDMESGKAARAATTMLEEGVSPTKSGVETLRARGNALNEEVTNLIANAKGQTIDKGAVASRINDVISRIERTQATPQDARASAERVYDQFLSNGVIPKNIPVEQAQEVKQGIYKMLKEKYGELGSETVESQKALARGMKEELEKSIPEIADKNSKASELWNALNVAERKALLESRKHIAGIAGMMIQHPGPFMAMMADRSAAFKSLLGRMVYSGGAQRAVGEAAAGGAEAMNQGNGVPTQGVPLSNIPPRPVQNGGIPLQDIPRFGTGMNGVRG